MRRAHIAQKSKKSAAHIRLKIRVLCGKIARMTAKDFVAGDASEMLVIHKPQLAAG
jgi:regulator of RNase E activity RraA